MSHLTVQKKRAGQSDYVLVNNLESVRKDIENVFRILKVRFKFLKTFNSLHEPRDINAASFRDMLHAAQHDAPRRWIPRRLSPYPGGLEESLHKKIWNHRCNGIRGMWTRGDDDTPIGNGVGTNDVFANVTPFASAKYLESKWKQVTEALIDHHKFGARNN